MDKNFLMPKTAVIFRDKTEKEISAEHMLAGYLPDIRKITDLSVRALPLSKKLTDNTVELSINLCYTLLYISNSGDYKRTQYSSGESFSLPAPGILEKSGENYEIVLEPCVLGVTHKLLSERELSTKVRLQLVTKVRKSAAVFLYPQTDCENVEYKYCELSACRETRENDVELDISDEVRLSEDMPPIGEILSENVLMCLDTVMRDSSLYAVGTANYSCVYLRSGTDTQNEKEYVNIEKAIGVECDLGISTDALVTVNSLTLTTNVSSDGYGDEKVISVGITAKLCPISFENEECSYCADGYSASFESECTLGSFECLTFEKMVRDRVKYETAIRSDGKSAVSVIQSYAAVFSPYAEISDGKLTVCARLYMSALCENTEGELCVLEAYENIRIIPDKSLPVSEGNYQFIPTLDVCKTEAYIENGVLKFCVSANLALAVLVKSTVTAVTALNVDDKAKRACLDGEFIIYYPKDGDTVWSVAKLFGTTPECIAKNNRINGDSLGGKRLIVIG